MSRPRPTPKVGRRVVGQRYFPHFEGCPKASRELPLHTWDNDVSPCCGMSYKVLINARKTYPLLMYYDDEEIYI